MNFDGAYDELVERIADRVVEMLGQSPPNAPDQESWHLMTLEQAAERLTRSERWIRERVKQGKLPVVRLDGGALAFELEDLRAFVEARRISEDSASKGCAMRDDWWKAA